MKFDVLALLLAAVAAEDTVTCVNPSDTWNPTDFSSSLDVTDSATCKAACEATIEDDKNTDYDYCCESNITDAVGNDPLIINSCTLY